MSDNVIMKTHCRTLRALYDTQIRSYEELLDLSGKKKIHTQNLQIYKPYNLRNTQLPELSKY